MRGGGKFTVNCTIGSNRVGCQNSECILGTKKNLVRIGFKNLLCVFIELYNTLLRDLCCYGRVGLLNKQCLISVCRCH